MLKRATGLRSFAVGIVLLLMIAGVNFVGNYLRDALEPRLKRE